MDIKQNNGKTISLKGKVRKIVLISCINFIIFGIGLFFFYINDVKFSTVKQWSKQITFWLPYHAKSLFISRDKIEIHIKQTHYQRLDYERKKAMDQSDEDGSTFVKEFNYVPAKIKFREKLIPVKIRLKGDRNTHYNTDNEWSFRIKAKNENTIFGMKNFSIHKPRARNYIHEWVFHEMLKNEDIITGRYFFADVSLNGNNLGPYAFEEHFEKRLIENNRYREAPILKFEENRSWDFRVTQITPFDVKSLIDSTQLAYFNKANRLLEGFKRGELFVSEVFDAHKLGKYFAISDVLYQPHGALWKSIRFYYNPITSRIEPIGYDGHFGASNTGNRLYLSSEIGVDPNSDWIHRDFGSWYRMLFNNSETFDYEFVSSYFKSLWEFTDPQYLDAFFTKINDELENNLSLIARDFPLLKDNLHSYGPTLSTFSKEAFYNHQKNIRNKLIKKSLFVYLNTNTNNVIKLDVENPETLPIIIKGILINNNLVKFRRAK